MVKQNEDKQPEHTRYRHSSFSSSLSSQWHVSPEIFPGLGISDWNFIPDSQEKLQMNSSR